MNVQEEYERTMLQHEVADLKRQVMGLKAKLRSNRKLLASANKALNCFGVPVKEDGIVLTLAQRIIILKSMWRGRET